MSKIGVFYGSTTGTTEDVARKIAEKLNVPQGDIHDASTLTDALVKEYDVLVLLCSVAEIPTHTATHFVTASVFCMKI